MHGAQDGTLDLRDASRHENKAAESLGESSGSEDPRQERLRSVSTQKRMLERMVTEKDDKDENRQKEGHEDNGQGDDGDEVLWDLRQFGADVFVRRQISGGSSYTLALPSEELSSDSDSELEFRLEC